MPSKQTCGTCSATANKKGFDHGQPEQLARNAVDIYFGSFLTALPLGPLYAKCL